ncbi:MAG: gluconate 2-dehydrogenase subunit 3 family protein [Kofleriaceae bacterium]
MQRRDFLAGSLGGVALLGCKGAARPGDPDPLNQHELDTISAIADTFLPGDDGTPGAHEANALATIADPAYGLQPYLQELVADLDQWCLVSKHLGFLGLAARDRELVLEQRMGLHGKLITSLYKPAYEGLLALAKLAFFGGLANQLGPAYLAFPGSSRGYAASSAAGAYASSGQPWTIARGVVSTIRITGAGTASQIHASAFATAEQLDATVRIHAPDGKHHEVALRGSGDVLVDAIALPIAGGPAAGAWRFEVARAIGAGRLECWSLHVRTDLDDRV